MLTTTGHIAYLVSTSLIVGMGATPEAADADARAALVREGVEIVDELPEHAYGEEPDGPPPVLSGDIDTLPATSALMDGGNDRWTERNGIACTLDEATLDEFPDDEDEAPEIA